jgi:hypothetical protein
MLQKMARPSHKIKDRLPAESLAPSPQPLIGFRFGSVDQVDLDSGAAVPFFARGKKGWRKVREKS